jgi:hypothetical protein
MKVKFLTKLNFCKVGKIKFNGLKKYTERVLKEEKKRKEWVEKFKKKNISPEGKEVQS